MASDCDSRVEEQPPALPDKRHRYSSVGSDCAILSPTGLQHQSYNDVFNEPTDCHAAQCPIHQRYDPSKHQMRFYSDGTPPPVPKKRLARTLSLPGFNAPSFFPPSPLSPHQRGPQNFDNPLYMMAPIPDTCFQEETHEIKPAGRSPVPVLNFSQLSFDTPDEHLPLLFSSFVDHEVVSQGIQHRHLLFLRSMVQSVEAGTLLQEEAAERHPSSYWPQDFLLCEGTEPVHIGDMIYYSVHSPKLPGKVLGLRVHQQTDETSLDHIRCRPPHVNVQDTVTCFQPSTIQKNSTSTWHTQDPSESGSSPAAPPGGTSTKDSTDSARTTETTIEAFLQKGYSVSIERDMPQATLEDFVQESSSLQGVKCLDFDRQVCALLLQILMGSHHLYNNAATTVKLRPQEILLVWPRRQKGKTEIVFNRDVCKWEEGLKKSRQKEELKSEKLLGKGGVQTLWRTHGCPRVILKPQPSSLSAPQSLIHVKSQIGGLIQFCLLTQARTSSLSSYRCTLLHLASQLQSDSGPQIADMVTTLQVLLWGPRVPLFDTSSSTNTAHNWLTIKRALLVMKLAEQGLVQDRSTLDWEDCMCLQYLSFTDSEAVASVNSQLWRTLKTGQNVT
ncbi:inactive tyrosine-protein kinase PRAG1 [Pholidichthys leucotaenia]